MFFTEIDESMCNVHGPIFQGESNGSISRMVGNCPHGPDGQGEQGYSVAHHVDGKVVHIMGCTYL